MNKLILFALMLASVAALSGREITIVTEPSGARIEIINPGTTRIRDGLVHSGPAEINLFRRTDPYIMEVSLAGYQTERLVYDYNNDDRKEFRVTLSKIEESKTFNFSSEPAGAVVVIDGRDVGQTPLTRTLKFTRSDKNSAWSQAKVSIGKTDFETQSFTLRLESPSELPTSTLPLLRQEATFTIKTTSGGRPLDGAALTVGDEVVGETPLKLTVEFSRPSGSAAWSTAVGSLGIEHEFISKTITLYRESARDVTVDLDPVTEVPVTKNFPSTAFSVRGPMLTLDESAPLGMLNPRDLSTPYSDLRKITNFTRNSPILQSVNSFALSPDGENVIYSVTMANEDGSKYSNLFMKAANDQSFSFLQITRGNQFFDTNPATGIDPSSNLVVFQSNRLGRRNSWDVSAVRVQDGRVVGGVLQLTHEPRFNFRPSIVSENRPAYFIGYDDFPAAQPYISSIRLDGSSYTVLGEVGEEVIYTQTGKLFIVRSTVDTNVKQIYSISAEGLTFSTVINDFEFAQANCFNPAISPDESKLIFVSDYARDEQDRKNNNLFVLDFETGRIQQITDNGSDDIAPRWSPTDPNVVFFLSNREGIYNIWRMELVVGN